MEQIHSLLEKYNNFKDAQIRSVHNLSETSKTITIAVMDDDGQDISSVEITFNDIKKSRILDGSVLAFLDMMSGVSIIKEHDLYGFALGSGTAMLHVHNAPMFVVASEISVQES